MPAVWEMTPTARIPFVTRARLDPATAFGEPAFDLDFFRNIIVNSRGISQVASRTSVERFRNGPTGNILTGNAASSLQAHPAWSGPDLGPVRPIGIQYESVGATNLLLRSHAIDNASWTKDNASVTADTLEAPDGTITADTMTMAASGTFNTAYQAATVTQSLAYTFSVYLKLGTLPSSAFKFAVRDDTAGAFIASDIAATPFPLVSHEWRRLVYPFFAPAGCSTVRPYIIRSNVANSGETLHVWGAQLEQGLWASSILITGASTGSKGSDHVTVLDFSQWYNPIEGTIYVEAMLPATAPPGGGSTILQIDANSSGHRVVIRQTTPGPNLNMLYINSGQTQASFVHSGEITAGQFFRAAFAFATDNFAGCVNGSSLFIDNSAVFSGGHLTHLRFGREQNGANAGRFIGLGRCIYWPWRLPNYALQAMTAIPV